MSQINNSNELEEEYEAEIIKITNEFGEEVAYEVLYEFEVHDTGKWYMILALADQSDDDEEEEEIIAFRFEEDEEGIQLFPIESEEEWKVVMDTFETIMAMDQEEQA